MSNPVGSDDKSFNRSTFQIVFYRVCRILARSLAPVIMRFRAIGRENYPDQGGALICSNHQSHFDPVIIGLTCDRRMNYVARQTLFGFAPFRWLIRTLDAIPIEREGIGIGGLKETLRRLKRGEIVLIFPEGTRTRNGELGKLRPGFCALARRGKVPIVPIGFDGGYDAWPRSRMVPGIAAVCVCIGKPITPSDFADWDDDRLLEEVEIRIRGCFERARELTRDYQPLTSNNFSTSLLTDSSINATTESPA